MRKLTNPKVIRETGTLYRSRPLVVRFSPKFLEIKEKGRREWVGVPWDAVFDLGQKLASRLDAQASNSMKGTISKTR